ncbi:DUF6894 family protein [Mesorhizobium sp. CO1-1-4]|uniref:DUF6894 family protein n=1 Tax=unclassified Mesorhizobium TaxID=325217 RepID=UPI00398C46CD
MALYNFDLNDNGTLYPDTEGTDLPSLEAAEDEASRALIEIARGRMPDGTFAEVALHVGLQSQTGERRTKRTAARSRRRCQVHEELIRISPAEMIFAACEAYPLSTRRRALSATFKLSRMLSNMVSSCSTGRPFSRSCSTIRCDRN